MSQVLIYGIFSLCSKKGVCDPFKDEFASKVHMTSTTTRDRDENLSLGRMEQKKVAGNGMDKADVGLSLNWPRSHSLLPTGQCKTEYKLITFDMCSINLQK